MIIEHTNLDGVLLVKPIIHEDERGYFFESYKDGINKIPDNKISLERWEFKNNKLKLKK